ncbi:MAG: nucleotidyltransferase domain-containing protein [Cyanobacteria bacterium M_surface_7_m2_040]|nr:nucleotidyltransferase domain-containing protein [Cyanobacteria bacterium K_Offshore_0m_m2_072]MBM5828086.1 nucleotidyltransferase domain-containing protein [Cyanobacteria bacterium M_surface_7_m2_040]
MATLAAIRAQKRAQRLAQLRQGASEAARAHPNGQVWLFGSLARGDWDAYSDVDLLAIAPSQEQAEALADTLLELGLGDDVLALTTQQWEQHTTGDDPYWRAIGRDALRLDGP